MSITPTTHSRHSFSARFAMITTVSLGLLAGPVALPARPAPWAAIIPEKQNAPLRPLTPTPPTTAGGKL
jgi:hypothetical protein